MTRVKKLCTPAFVYLVISVISIVMMMIQNMGNTNRYCVGTYECSVPNTMMVFVSQIVYVAIWTFILNWICKNGYTSISWFLVLLPIILMAILIALLLINGTA